MEKTRSKYRSLKELNALYGPAAKEDAVALFKRVRGKLVESGYGPQILELSIFLEKNPEFLEVCDKIQIGIDSHNAILLLVNDMKLIWDIHKFFPILYALNNLGKSVFRINMKHLIDGFLEKDKDNAEFEKKFYQNLALFSNIFSGDIRISAWAASIEGLITPLMFTKRVVFSAFTTKIDSKSAREEAMQRLKTLYSPAFEQNYVAHVAPIFIQTFKSKASLWTD